MTAISQSWRAGFAAAVAAPLRHQPGRVALAVLGIALGVSLGVAVHLINASALNEFSRAMHSLAGEADIVIRGPRAGFADDVYPRVARLAEVQSASPALEIEARLAGRRDTLKILGLDPFRAAQVQPALIGDISDKVLELFDPRTILLSPAAADSLQLRAGDRVAIQVGTSTSSSPSRRCCRRRATVSDWAIMDIASAQWTLARLGRINRIDIKVKPGTDIAAFRSSLQSLLPAGTQAVTPELEADRGCKASRAPIA
jgi:putative ABC transport system permease protein